MTKRRVNLDIFSDYWIKDKFWNPTSMPKEFDESKYDFKGYGIKYEGPNFGGTRFLENLTSKAIKEEEYWVISRASESTNPYYIKIISSEGPCPFRKHYKEHTGRLTRAPPEIIQEKLTDALKKYYQIKYEIRSLLEKKEYIKTYNLIGHLVKKKHQLQVNFSLSNIKSQLFVDFYCNLRKSSKDKAKKILRRTGYSDGYYDYYRLETEYLHRLEKEIKNEKTPLKPLRCKRKREVIIHYIGKR